MQQEICQDGKFPFLVTRQQSPGDGGCGLPRPDGLAMTSLEGGSGGADGRVPSLQERHSERSEESASPSPDD